MIKCLLLAGSLVFSMAAFSQTTLFQDDFESGGGNWTMNTGSGQNQWIINAEYLGFSGFIADTPDEPAGISGSPESNYMHIYNPAACSGLGICNASFDTGSTSNQPTQTTAAIDATGYTNVTLSFWYLSAGASGSAYGTVEYSVDNGTTWISTGTNYVNVTTWTQTSVTLPAWDNAAGLKFRFRWQNGSSGNDPAFAIDDVTVTGMSGSFASITTDNVTPTSAWCFNSSVAITVNYTVSGTINSGNVYTIQLSDASGSFAAPTTIGTMPSGTSGSFATNATIPASTPAGTGYRIRVVASDPATTGTDNGTNLVIHPQPTINIVGNPADGIMCSGQSVTLLGTGGVSYSWTPTASLNSSTQAQVIATPANTTTYTAVGTDINGCTNSATFLVTVQNCSGIEENALHLLSVYPNPASGAIHLTYDASLQVSSIELLDQGGRVIAVVPAMATDISTSQLAPGSYFVRMTHNNGYSIARFIRQ